MTMSAALYASKSTEEMTMPPPSFNPACWAAAQCAAAASDIASTFTVWWTAGEWISKISTSSEQSSSLWTMPEGWRTQSAARKVCSRWRRRR